MTAVDEIPRPTRAAFDAELRPLYRPFVIRGIARAWPIVAAGERGALNYLERLDSGAPTDVMVAQPGERGRFFYSPDMRGFNFRRERATITQLSHKLQAMTHAEEPPGMYAGATPTRTHLPGFDRDNPFPLIDESSGVQTRLWLGNATQVATHFDLSDNFAVVALGRRTFTLFPPEAVAYLYVGPLDVTLAGQPVSMVDPLAPDFERYPRFAKAIDQALTAELGPGDALYIPSLWWHHVAATAPLNILVNYWHNDAARGGGFLALVHAILAIRDQPAPQREAWRAWFDQMVFGPDAPASADHLPEHARGVTGPPSPQRDARIRVFIARILSER